MNYIHLYPYVIDHLLQKLDPRLLYHGIHHTRDEVLPAVDYLAERLNITGEDLALLRTGALFHDAGFIEVYNDHETTSKRLAAAILPDFGYTPEQIETVQALIEVTRLPQAPKTLLQQVMCDADLESIGRDDFFVTAHHLRLELKWIGQPVTVRAWYERELQFLLSHRYFTQVARDWREAGKQDNIKELKLVLGC